MATATDTEAAPDPRLLDIENAGPIVKLTLQVPDAGVVIFKGPQGSGKSTALRAVEALATPGEKPEFTVRDRELNAHVSGFGATLKLRKETGRTGRSGELQVESLEGVSAADLVDPGLKTPLARDAARIKALVALTGQGADASLFHELVGGKETFERLFPEIAIGVDDLLMLSGRVKKALDVKAIEVERAADQASAAAKGCRDSATGVDINATSDPTALQKALESALEAKTVLERRLVDNTRAKGRYDAAKLRLTDAQQEQLKLPSVDETKLLESAALTEKNLAESELEVARRAFETATNRAALAKQAWTGAVEARSSAESRLTMISGWEASLKDGEPVVPSEEDLEAVNQAAVTARKAIEAGVLITKARGDLEKAVKFDTQASEHLATAKVLRVAADNVYGVLSRLVSKCTPRLRVEDDRLVTDTVRGKTYFDDLSDGERWKHAIDLCVERVGATGLFTIPQWAWGELQPSVKQEINQHAKSCGVLVLTAEVTDGDALEAAVME